MSANSDTQPPRKKRRAFLRARCRQRAAACSRSAAAASARMAPQLARPGEGSPAWCAG
jgi:hypothetical protein